MRRLIAFISAFAGAVSLTTLGLPSITSRAAEGSQLVTLFTVDDLTEIAKQQGATEIQPSVEDGTPVISLKKDDLYFAFVLRGCQNALGCTQIGPVREQQAAPLREKRPSGERLSHPRLDRRVKPVGQPRIRSRPLTGCRGGVASTRAGVCGP